MCYNCGCHLPEDDMGHPDNITNQTLQEIANKQNKTFDQVRNELFEWLQKKLDNKKVTANKEYKEMFHKASLAWGQSIPDAERLTYELLQEELEK